MPKRDYLHKDAPEVLQLIADHAAHVVATEMAVDGGLALEIGQEIAKRIAQVLGGCRVNIPTGTWNGQSLMCFEMSKRDLAIYRSFNGQNREEILARYQISKARLYQIIAAVSDRLQAGSRRPTAPTLVPSPAPAESLPLTPIRESA